MKYLGFFLFLICSIFGSPIRHEIPLNDETSLVYYLESLEKPHPLLIAIEGSYKQARGPESVLRLHNKLAPAILETGCGIVTLERRGADDNMIDEARFHYYNTPSQRLEDHLRLLEHLTNFPPKNWNGQFIILGGSEGGPIAIKLAHATNPLACIPIVGCSDQPFKELIWTYMQSSDPDSDSPLDRAEYDKWCETVKANPDPNQWIYGQTFLYWADALDQTEFEEFFALKCPVFVIAGSKDLECPSTDRLIEKAHQNHQNVTYLRVEGMGHHDALFEPKWKVLEKLQEFLISINTLYQK